jgi:hypothetical protein
MTQYQQPTAGQPVALDAERDYSTIALVLAVISVPGSILTWGTLPGGGFVWGAPFAVAAVALGAMSRRSSPGKSMAAIVIGGAMVAMMVVWTIVDLLS